MTDRELLELAAKAVGESRTKYMDNPIFGIGMIGEGVDCGVWNPLTDDGDALRLAVALQLIISNEHLNSDACCVRTLDDSICITERVGKTGDKLTTDDYRATRRAIVRAAAEIGKAMP